MQARRTPERSEYYTPSGGITCYSQALTNGQVIRALKPGDVLILGAYTPDQVPRDTGGPDTPDRTPTAAELVIELSREVIEGRGHTGLGAMVQFIARKH